jgi:predicted nucleic acid-binding Zn ribbon protein
MKKRQSNQSHIKDLITRFLEENQIQKHIDVYEIKSHWHEIVGKMLSNHTTELSLREKILVVKLDSSTLRNEMLYRRESVIQAVNNHFGKKIIQDVLFM